ncbi:hypothetical protein K1719_036029 [Acacia pycnantha]|nr:hypothetical protein K1719_036029 [Acacia pycnantha]
MCQCYMYRGPRAWSSRNQPSRGDLNEPDPDDHHHSIQIQGLGLELWVVSSLPTSQFKKNEGSNKECAICLSEFEEEEWVKRLPSCAHIFHVSCIATWFRSRSNCPICRSNVNHQDHLALSLESSVSNYASPDETLSREELSPGRPSQIGRHTTTLQPTSGSN